MGEPWEVFAGAPGSDPGDLSAWRRIGTIDSLRVAHGELVQEAGAAAAGMRRFRAARLDVRCDQHGRMMFDFARDWWACPGYDGEGCPVVVGMETIDGGATSGEPGWHLVLHSRHS
jgi:hypothetical protein